MGKICFRNIRPVPWTLRMLSFAPVSWKALRRGALTVNRAQLAAVADDPDGGGPFTTLS